MKGKKVVVVEAPDPLTEEQVGRLTMLENDLASRAGCVAEIFQYSLVAGRALAEINEQRLYRAEHKTFEKYVVAKLQMSRGYAYELMGVSKVVGVLSDASDIPTQPSSITQVKRLLKLKDDSEKLVKAWKLALSWTTTGSNVKASDIGNAVRHALNLQRRKRTVSRRLEPTLFHNPERMAKYIIENRDQEYANTLALALMAKIAAPAEAATARVEAVS